ncbi:MAG: glycogen debranching N-terminal domain-containing protein [Candidatus Acidiferrales bacterium]
MLIKNPVIGGLVKILPRPETVQVSRGRTVIISRLDGNMDSDELFEGLWIYETRVLCRYVWLMNGKRPNFSCGSNIEQFSWMGYYAQAPENCKETPAHECDPMQETIELRLTRSVGEGMHEDIDLTNHTQISTTVDLALEFEHEFASREEIKKGRKQKGDLNSAWSQLQPGLWELVTNYNAIHEYSHQGDKGVAEMSRGTRLRIESASSQPEYNSNRISFGVELGPHEHWHACLSWLASVQGELLPLSGACSQEHASDWDHRRIVFLNAAADIKVPHSQDLSTKVGRVLQRSRIDLADLRFHDLDKFGGVTIAAGVPMYMEVFGRDLLASAWQASVLTPELLEGALNTLSHFQANEKDAWRDAQPGRIAHEVHTDPLSVLQYSPQALDYGSVSGCSLYPIAVAELWHWTGDKNLVRKYIEPAIRAIGWADTYSLDSTNFYRYETHSEQGVKNQGWKDSGDAIVHSDGSQVEAPIGTCEMQAFMFAAKQQFSEVLWWLGEKELALRYYREARELRERFNDKFWMEDEGYYGMAIGPDGKLVRSVASDPGHCLLSGIVDDSRVKRVAYRMMRDDMFSGWGIRTLSALHPAYNPFSYHRGSVWPVTNAGFVLAFARYGLHGEMHRLAQATFEAAQLFDDDRLPEVFGGHQRTPENPFPGLYTRANYPQAWSASAPFTVVQALTGLYGYAPLNVLIVDPHLPEWLPQITVERLRVGKSVVSLQFFRKSDGESDYKVVDLQGELHIVRQPSPWSFTSGWAERMKDAISSILPHGKSSAA